MTVEEMQTLLADVDIAWTEFNERRLDGHLEAATLHRALSLLVNRGDVYLAAITGMDLYGSVEGDPLELLYHLCAGALVVTLRVQLNREDATIASVCDLFEIASPYERETGEMMGITFSGTPDTSRLFLPDDWQDGIYPLRKDAVLKGYDDDQ